MYTTRYMKTYYISNCVAFTRIISIGIFIVVSHFSKSVFYITFMRAIFSFLISVACELQSTAWAYSFIHRRRFHCFLIGIFFPPTPSAKFRAEFFLTSTLILFYWHLTIQAQSGFKSNFAKIIIGICKITIQPVIFTKVTDYIS